MLSDIKTRRDILHRLCCWKIETFAVRQIKRARRAAQIDKITVEARPASALQRFAETSSDLFPRPRDTRAQPRFALHSLACLFLRCDDDGHQFIGVTLSPCRATISRNMRSISTAFLGAEKMQRIPRRFRSASAAKPGTIKRPCAVSARRCARPSARLARRTRSDFAISLSASLVIAPRVSPSRSATSLGAVRRELIELTQNNPFGNGHAPAFKLAGEGRRGMIGHKTQPIAKVSREFGCGAGHRRSSSMSQRLSPKLVS